MYRLMIIADDGGKRSILTIGGEQASFIKEFDAFIRNGEGINWIHGSNERLAEALFIGLMKKYEQEAQ